MPASLEVGEGGVVGGDEAGFGSRLDRHVAHRHAAFHRQGADGFAAVLDDRADAATGTDEPDDGEDDVLGGHAGGQGAVDVDGHGVRDLLVEGLGGEDVFHLGGADAERQRPEGTVGGGVAVAAHDGHARQGQAQFRADDVDDALVGVAHGELGDVERRGVLAQHLDLTAGDGIGDGLVGGLGGDVVVLGGHGQLGTAHAPSGEAKAIEGLGRGDLVHEVQVDVEQLWTVAAGHHLVGVPDLLAECFRCHVALP